MNRNTIKALTIAGLLALSAGAQGVGAVQQPAATLWEPLRQRWNSVRLYSSQGGYLGNLNDNRYDSNSVSNPYGQYGSRYSQDSINNPYGRYGNPYGGQ
jgi:hypothetical protein